MIDSVVVRPLQASDRDFIEPLGARAFGEYNHRAAAHTLALAFEANALGFVACRGAVRVGFYLLELQSQRHAHLSAIAVLESFRGAGTGQRLLVHAEDQASAHGRRELRLVTCQANLGALDLFLKSGFRIDKRIPRYYSRGQDAVLMIKTLRNAQL